MKTFFTFLTLAMLAFLASAQCPGGAVVLDYDTPTAISTSATLQRCYPATHPHEFSVTINAAAAPSEFADHRFVVSGGTDFPWRITALNDNCDTILRTGYAGGNPVLALALHYDGVLTVNFEAPAPQNNVLVTWSQSPPAGFTYLACNPSTSINDEALQVPIERGTWRVFKMDGTMGQAATLPLEPGRYYNCEQKRVIQVM